MICPTRSNRGRKLPPEVLTPSEARRLLDACSATSATGLRNRALIALLYRGGLRTAEALSLEPRDVDLAEGRVNVRHGKGRKARMVGIDATACEIVGRWLQRKERDGIGGPVLSTLKGGPLDSGYVRRTFKRLAKAAGIAKRVHPHGLRHSFASGLLEEGVGVGVISKALGHGSIATTSTYLDHVNPQAAIDAAKKREWA